MAQTIAPTVFADRLPVRHSPEGAREWVSGRRGASFEARSVDRVLRLGRHDVRVEDDQPCEGTHHRRQEDRKLILGHAAVTPRFGRWAKTRSEGARSCVSHRSRSRFLEFLFLRGMAAR
jgi:hypothetical protein